MKKNIKLIAMAATVLALVSCSKEPAAFESNSPAVFSGSRTIVFKTAFTKTTIDGGTISWAEGDTVKIMWIDTAGTVQSVKAAVDAATGEISAVVTPFNEGKGYYAIYPATTTTAIRTGETADSLEFKLGNTCDGTWAQAHVSAAYTEETNEPILYFKNITNAVKFEVKADDVDMVEIRTNDGSNIEGTYFACFIGEDVDEIDNLGSGAKIQVSINGPGVYYAPIAPNADWLAGFTAAETKEGEIVNIIVGNNPVSLERNTLIDLGCLEDHKVNREGGIFLKPTACGTEDGSSWDNAGGSELLRRLLGTYVGGWLLDGRNVYMAAGEYDTWNGSTGTNGICTLTSNIKISSYFRGGYSASSTGTDISQRDVENNETVITSHATDKYGRVLYWSGYKCDQTFDGITFKVQANNNYRGCMYANCGINEGNLSFINCTWKDANVEASASVGQFADFDVLFQNCTIKNNKTTYKNSKAATNTVGGTLIICNTCNATFNNCLFEGNSTAAPGSAILIAGGKVLINNCIFKGNETTKSSVTFGTKTANSGQCGTVAVIQYATSFNSGDASTNNNPEVYIDNCVFEGNKSCTCGTDIYAYNNVTGRHPLIYINRTYFNGAAANGDALKLTEWYQSSCILTENTSAVDGQIELCMYNCTCGPTSSTVFSSEPCISSHYGNWSLINCTVVDRGVATIRNNAVSTEGRTSTFNLYNCVISRPSGASNVINLASKTAELNCGYNIMGKCKNRYSMLYDVTTGSSSGDSKPFFPTDGYVNSDDLGWDLTTHAADKYFTFQIAEGKDADTDRPVQYTTKADVEAYMAEHLPTFDAWLKTIHTDPYAIDIRGEQRNAGKLQKGSWDPGL